MHLPQQAACTLFTPLLPRFHPDGTYQPFLPRFYPVLEGKMRRGKKEGKNRVNPFYPGIKTGLNGPFFTSVWTLGWQAHYCYQ